ncbi:hypothetical protein B4903_22390, partial [Yersinia frederiksenii]
RLTFAWSRDNGVILLPIEQGYQLICRNSASLEAILEGNRVGNQPQDLNFVTDDEFEIAWHLSIKKARSSHIK